MSKTTQADLEIYKVLAQHKIRLEKELKNITMLLENQLRDHSDNRTVVRIMEALKMGVNPCFLIEETNLILATETLLQKENMFYMKKQCSDKEDHYVEFVLLLDP
jgi:hypothetical protein